MQYRSFGRLDWKVSALGFGTMRLPTLGGDQTKVDMAQTIHLIRYAVDHGVNYVDSAYTYHDGGAEVAIGKALGGKYRGKAKIATKMPVFSVNTREDLDRILSEQMTRLNTKFIDFYLFHSLNLALWRKVKDLGMIKWAERQVAKGRLGHLGFSFHDSLEVFEEIVDAYDGWTISQIQYNYLDENYQAGKSGLKYAAARGLAVVVMEPLSGGMLAVNPPPEIQRQWRKSAVRRSAADWALQWVWNQPEVAVALSGMNALTQVQENLESACHASPNSLSAEELGLLAKAAELYRRHGYIGCTKCRYCIHCPQSIDIPAALAFLNQRLRIRNQPEEEEKAKKSYLEKVPPSRRANGCLGCGQCEAICPQHLPIRKLLREATTCLC